MSYSDADIDSFTITSRSEIVFYLHQLINDQEPLSVMFEEGRESMLTIALDLSEEKNQLILDWGGSEETNKRLLKAGSTSFVANPLGVRNLFQTAGVTASTFQNRPAFVTALPKKYVRLQRREFFRLTLPVTQRAPCRISLNSASGERSLTVSVIDLCVGGVGLEGKGTLNLELGQVLLKASIDLGKTGIIHADMEVRFVGHMVRGSENVTRIGCKFVKLGRSDDVTVQRFITQIQRDQRARLG
ncbi:MAG: flagellar brake protein [Rhodocyclaceae bacterium]|jgi:c-di-GMP-binding flagellar brake protein YcgR|nr:flagellar brake protein [Rhodocyclaceae bacterium]